MIKPFLEFGFDEFFIYQDYFYDNNIEVLQEYLINNKNLYIDFLLDIYFIDENEKENLIATVKINKIAGKKI